MNPIARLFPLLLVVVAGCEDQSTVPTANRPSFAAAGPAACPATPSVTVSDEAGLRTAIATATPGAVIAIQGMIGLTQDDTIRTAGVTVTCATPGAGLFAVAGSGVQDLLIAAAKRDVVDRLVLDASQAGDSPLAGFNDGTTFFAESIRFTNNSGTCAPGGECVFISGGLGAVVTDNHFEAPGSFSGIQRRSMSPVSTAPGSSATPSLLWRRPSVFARAASDRRAPPASSSPTTWSSVRGATA